MIRSFPGLNRADLFILLEGFRLVDFSGGWKGAPAAFLVWTAVSWRSRSPIPQLHLFGGTVLLVCATKILQLGIQVFIDFNLLQILIFR